MKKLIFATIFPVLLGACAGIYNAPPAPCSSADAVRVQLGRPTDTYADGADTVLEYALGPTGQRTYMARLGPDGRLRSYEQVLTMEKFGTIKRGRDNKDSILHTFGRPSQQLRYASVDGDVWAYRYKEQQIWDSIMYVQFDRNGVVQTTVNGPDPDHEERRGR